MLSLCLTVFSEEKAIQSTWAVSPVSIDGSNAEWQAEALNLNTKYGIDYAFKNDAEHLYVIFAFKDRKFLSTVQFTGVTLWLNTEGKGKKEYGINFKEKRVSADELIAAMEKQHGPLPEERKNQLKANPSYLLYQGEVIDKKGNNLTSSAVSGELDVPIFREKRERGGLVSYELKIPLNILEKLSADQKMKPGDAVKVGFEWGGMTKEVLEQRAKGLGASGAAVSEGRAEVAINEERSDRIGGGERDLLPQLRRGAQKYSFWVDIKLAQNQ
jgi:hypothetical protein